MHLFLVQHGQAKAESEDPERPLTEQGVDDVTRVAGHALEQLGVRPARIVHSGKTRARQTAEIWAGELGLQADEVDGLAPNDDPTAWVGRIEANNDDDLMLVGHLPHLARLAGLLLAGDADRQPVKFQPGGLVALERTDAGWQVAAVIPPEAA